MPTSAQRVAFTPVKSLDAFQQFRAPQYLLAPSDSSWILEMLKELDRRKVGALLIHKSKCF
jgi:hypothetical protein